MRSTAARRCASSIPATGSAIGQRRGDGSTQLRVRDDGTFGDHDDEHEHGRHATTTRWDEGRRVTIADGTAGLDARADLLRPGARGAGGSRSISRSGAVTVTQRGRRAHARRPQRAGHRHRDQGQAQHRRGLGRRCGSPRREGDLSVDTGSGAVEVTALPAARSLSIDTGSGDVTGSELESDELSVDTGSGEIRLAGRDVAASSRSRPAAAASRPTSGATIASLAGRDRLGRHRDPRAGRRSAPRSRSRPPAATSRPISRCRSPGTAGITWWGRSGTGRERSRSRPGRAASGC